jgi:hypothetical protein
MEYKQPPYHTTRTTRNVYYGSGAACFRYFTLAFRAEIAFYADFPSAIL